MSSRAARVVLAGILDGAGVGLLSVAGWLLAPWVGLAVAGALCLLLAVLLAPDSGRSAPDSPRPPGSEPGGSGIEEQDGSEGGR